MADFSMSEIISEKNRIYKADKVEKRIINSNDMIMQKLAKLQSEQEAKNRSERLERFSRETGEEFSEEIGPDDLDPGILNSSEEENIDYGEIARNEADDIINTAREEAERTIQEARAEAESIKQQAFEEARSKGYEEGKKAASEEYEGRARELDELEQRLNTDYENNMASLESDLLDTMLDIFEKVFFVKFSDSRELLLFLIKNAMRNIRETKNYKVKVSEADIDFVRGSRDEFVKIIGNDANLDIVMDVSLSAGDCIVDADSGVYDCSFKVELENLKKELKALSTRQG